MDWFILNWSWNNKFNHWQTSRFLTSFSGWYCGSNCSLLSSVLSVYHTVSLPYTCVTDCADSFSISFSVLSCCHGYVKPSSRPSSTEQVGGANSGSLAFKGVKLCCNYWVPHHRGVVTASPLITDTEVSVRVAVSPGSTWITPKTFSVLTVVWLL